MPAPAASRVCTRTPGNLARPAAESGRFAAGWKAGVTWVLLPFLMLLLFPSPAPGQSAASREYSIKAAFLYNFVKFVDWPAQALPSSSNTLVIGVLGRNPFGSALNTLSGKTVKGKTLVVRQFSSVPEQGACHVLFISSSEQDRMKQLLDALRSSSILTVSETRGFAQSGGIINFVVQDEKVRFEINPAAAERARLNLSSDLLRLAKIVRA
jgi:hypothetical protein